VGAEVALGEVEDLGNGELAQLDFSDASVLVSEQFSSAVDTSEDIEEAG
jgi:hypothetical protein